MKPKRRLFDNRWWLVSWATLLSACTSPIPLGESATQSAARPGKAITACDALQTSLANLPDTRIVETRPVPTGELRVGNTPIGAHCLVKGAMAERTGPLDGLAYAIGFEMRLPIDWNGRFWYQANGGIDGTIQPALGAVGGGPITSALSMGFAVVSADAGHDNRITRGPGFGIDPQARLDYGYQTVGKLTPVAKAIVAATYGRGPDRSYIGGCSNGGRHAMVAASRYPDQFDGYLIGAPGYRLPLAAIANVFGAQRYAQVATDPKDLSTAFTINERKAVADAVLRKCDALDGLKDGIIQDQAACSRTFDLRTDVATCAGERDGSCLSGAQKNAIAPIFSGATTRDGRAFYSSFPVDAGLTGKGVTRWEFSAPLKLDSGAIGLIFSVPPQDPKTFNPTEYVLKTPVDQLLAAVSSKNKVYQESALSFMMPVEPGNLSGVRDAGAKIIAYHGNSDMIFSANDTEAWLNDLQLTHNGQADQFVRYYRVPGMDHCRGGPATDQFDMISPLVDWVEHGRAPEAIIASVRGPGNAGGENEELPDNWSPTRTRPLCPAPKVARYDGKGHPESAASFRCQ